MSGSYPRFWAIVGLLLVLAGAGCQEQKQPPQPPVSTPGLPAPTGSTLTVWGWPLGPTGTAWVPFEPAAGSTLEAWGWLLGPTGTAWAPFEPAAGSTLEVWGWPLGPTGTAWFPFEPAAGSTLTMWGWPTGKREKVPTPTATPTRTADGH
ncbi:MAG: hypothetical protein AB1439_04990 [candidate division FCPU426 bacterium]